MIELTEKSANKLRQVLSEQGVTEDVLLRVGIKAGGCSGFTYKWDMVDTDENGTVIDNLLVLDEMAEMFVIGCTVDYVKELGGSYLKVINPNAKAQCGCGESFGV